MSEQCHKLHFYFNQMPRFEFPFDSKEIPLNGIYILFEKGEKAHGFDRIVRVGTHTGDNQLPSRLKQHFLKQNKDRSIFRKNIGRAMLSSRKDPFLEQWEWDLTTRKEKERYGDILNTLKQKEIENQVSNYIQSNFSFVVLEVNEKEKRLLIESRIISTVSWCQECSPTDKWFGLNSPKEKIRQSGLWLVNELYKEEFSKEEFSNFEKSFYDNF